MIYMVEMNLPDSESRSDWDRWYISHMRMLITIPGIHATQRFECIHNHNVPFVALHEVDGPHVFESKAYKEKAGPSGTGEWQAKMTNWSRNVFDGMRQTPLVTEDAFLVLIENGVAAPNKLPLSWLKSIGLDKSVERRAIGVCLSETEAKSITIVPGVRVLKPLTSKLVGEIP